MAARDTAARPGDEARETAQGLRVLDAEQFDVMAAMGGWRGAVEATAPTLVFIVVLALAPLAGAGAQALTLALGGALAVAGAAMLARVVRRQPLTQALQGLVLVGVSAVWAWRSGQARDFYVVGLAINVVWILVLGGSLLMRRPLVGVVVDLWRGGGGAWLHDPDLAGARRRATAATWLLTAMFAVRVGVELPLYLMGDAAAGALGVARLILGLPLFVVVVWLAWRLVRPVDARSQAVPGPLDAAR